jgi:hypothetical protein
VPFKVTIVYDDDHFTEIWADGPGQVAGIVYDAALASRAGGPAMTVAKHIEIDPFAKVPVLGIEPTPLRRSSLTEKLEDEVS